MKREEVIAYEIYVKSFNDSNGDGIGDLKGITDKIEYLSELGINYLWLTPIYISPQFDNGYDVQDYYKINPEYGTMDDFNDLVKKANDYGIEIMLDMVLNHTSTKHEWFQKAINGCEKYQNYYIFKESEKEPTNWKSKFGGNAWEYVESIDKWYLHLFDVTQADLNWENPELKKELYKIVNFWKVKGVKGFRFDVINLISKPNKYEDDYEFDGRKYYTDGPKVHELIRELNNNTFGDQKGFVTVGEMSSTSLDNCIKYTNPKNEELMMTFNFHHVKIDYKDGLKWVLKDPDFEELRNLYKKWSEGMSEGRGWMANFLSNHDQPRHLSRFGNEDEYRYESATSMASTYILLKGTPYIYYGEEIGMLNAGYLSIEEYDDVESHNNFNIIINEGKSKEEALHIISERSRDNGRIPMQWNSKINAGFSSGKPWLKTSDQYTKINYEIDIKNKKSIFKWYKKIIDLRKNENSFVTGAIEFLDSEVGYMHYKRFDDESEYHVISNWTNKSFDLEMPKGEIILNNKNSFNNTLSEYQVIVIKTK